MPREYNLNLFNILIISATVHGLVLGLIILFSKKRRAKPNNYLGQLVLYLSLSNLYYWFPDTRMLYGWPYYRFFYVPWELLMLPTFYFFVSGYLGRKSAFRKFLLWPFFVDLVAHLFLMAYRLSYPKSPFGRELMFGIMKFEEYFNPVFSVFIIILIFRMIRSHDRSKPEFSGELRQSTTWLKQLLYAGIGICIVLFSYTLIKALYLDNSHQFDNIYYICWLGISILIYWIGYAGIYHSGIFNQRKDIRKTIKLTSPNAYNSPAFLGPTTQPAVKSKAPTYNFSRFSEIDNIIRSEKLFLDPSFGLASLAEKFNLSEGYLSQLLKNFTETNFPTYINNLRVEEVKSLLSDSRYDKYTIVAVGLEAGFNSKSAFYSAFRKQTGLTPTAFRKQA